ncbi:hypothetical protein DYB30_002360 [Aphanomyces astaci]|uniref:Uncharacterized protein n=1 Tax=Aphanomyces astaci TaxID=112090 RepID=A0A397BSW5_APHAT|nr:hypothetical protein DYB36_004858 [Aphanomyces astaci]RHY41155.1 hypothetical protein DYB34_004743 [Aphanomyces astaci]RHY51856.1 hypothetical protein DYB38_005581 [Aphanomyces astaci]RHY79904.1 hypothetical protein DYB30_002360 [Aphanomyces astaci]RHZ30546.1 hypothetical protein DYB31_006556 [Aphanomyces astaci]
MMHIQRNDVDDLVLNGLGTPELWHNLSEELQGVKVLEHPRVPKKVLIKAIRMQTIAMRCMAGEFDQLRDRLEAVEKDTAHGQKQLEKVNTKVLALEAALDGAKKRVVELEADIVKESKRIDAVEGLEGQLKNVRDELKFVDKAVESQKVEFGVFATRVEHEVVAVRAAVDATKASVVALESKMEEEVEVKVLTSEDILHGNMPLSRWFDQYADDNRRREDILKDTSDKFAKQSRGIHDMMNDTRKALDDNTSAVEDVQRALIEKADRVKVDLIIESKYEEIIEQLQKAMTAISEDEVENLRAFIDLKMNREDVLSALTNKADKDEMQFALSLSIHFRYTFVCSLEKDRCLACNSVLASGLLNGPPPMGSTYGGGFQTAAPGYDKGKGASMMLKPPLPSLNFDSYLLGMDGHVYHGDVDAPQPAPLVQSASDLSAKLLVKVLSPNQTTDRCVRV